MRYGLIIYSGDHGGRNNRGGRFNVGDNIQMHALRRIYMEEMGIPREEIVEIDFHDLGTYDGEYVIVPINLYFSGCSDAKETWFPASPKIIPVFIGVHFSSNYLTEKEVAYLRTYAPIGCRDAYTLRTMRKYNIPAYLFGCITATLPKRPQAPDCGKTYIVDVHDKVVQNMPESLKKDVRYTYHEEEGMFTPENFAKADQKAIDLLTEYYNHAGVVITSRLHCASPCVAMGIPVVMVVKERSSRFAWLDKLIPIYTIDEVEKIKWDVEQVDFEVTKKKMIDLVTSRLLDAKRIWEPVYDLSGFFESGLQGEYVDPNQKLLQSIDANLFKEGDKRYIIWGTTAQAEQAYQHILETYLDAQLVGVIDMYNKNLFHGHETVQDLKILDDNPGISVIVTPPSAKNDIKEILRNRQNRGTCIFFDGEVL